VLSREPLGFQLEQKKRNASSLHKNTVLLLLHKLFNTKASSDHRGGEKSAQCSTQGCAKLTLSQLYFLLVAEPCWGWCIVESLKASVDASSLKRAILAARIIGALRNPQSPCSLTASCQ